MSKFNESNKGITQTTNKAGGKAYILRAKEKLVTQVLTSFFNEKKYYGDNSDEIIETINEVLDSDAKFVANLCIYARNELYLRSISHVMVGQMAHHTKGKAFVKALIPQVVLRADDMTEIMAYYLSNFKKPIPNSLKKGLALAFPKFDEYQLAKYNRANTVTLKDVLLICHAKPENDSMSDMWKRLIEDKLEVPYTWETQLSTRGNTKEVWEELIASKKVGYMALLRNLRNIVNSSAGNIDEVLAYLRNEEAVKKSKQLPFRFFAAYRELQNSTRPTSKILDTIEDAMSISVQNLPRLAGTTFLVSDNSGSMGSKLSNMSTICYNDISSLLMSIASRFCDEAITSVFGENFAVVNVSQKDGIFTNMQKFVNKDVGHSTNLYKSIEWLINTKTKVDRIVILSDMQAYTENGCYWGYGSSKPKSNQQLLQEYKEKINPEVVVHSIDLTGYGTTQFQGNNVNLISGWSEKVLEFMSLAEQGTNTLTKKIEGYYFK